MRRILIRVRKIMFAQKDDHYYVFMATVYKVSKKTGLRKPTREVVTCTGRFISLYEGDLFYVEAQKREHPMYGEQYQILVFNRVEPGTIEEIQKFLIQRGKGLGIQKAKIVTEHYGLETLQRIAEDETALDIIKIPEGVKKAVRQDILANRTFEELLMFLQMHHIDNIYSTPLYRKYETAVVSKLQDNPYAPYLDGIWDFRLSENLHASLGLVYNTPQRLCCLVLAAIRWDSENGGNLFLPEDLLESTLSAFLRQIHSPYLISQKFTQDEIAAALAMLQEYNMVAEDRTVSPVNIYLPNNLANENRIAKELKRLKTEPKRICFTRQDIDQFLKQFEMKQPLAPEQREGVRTALTSPISLMTGGPGTGKTHTIRTIISCVQTLEPRAEIRVCAPTGKAAVRTEEMSGLPASTIHRMLRLFRHGEQLGAEELDCDILIVDEYSMVDAYLCSKLFTAAASHTRVILVGDYNQLPSVGPGLVLRDFIHSGKIDTIRLTKVFRQAEQSRIIKNAYAIINQTADKPIPIKCSKRKKGDFYFIEASTIPEIRSKIQSSVQKLKRDYHYPISDIQILTPVKKTPLGSNALNLLFQEEFLPAASTPSVSNLEKEFRLGDKVIHIKNNAMLSVFNGEVGYVKTLDYASDHMLTVEYPDNKLVDYSLKDMDELDLAYGLTVHKSQGSEFPVVIIPVHESILHGLNKNLLYTALTRAKDMVIIIGSKNALSIGMRNEENIGARRSMLVQKINNLI